MVEGHYIIENTTNMDKTEEEEKLFSSFIFQDHLNIFYYFQTL